MRDQDDQSFKEAKRVEKRTEEEAQLLAKEHLRKKSYLAREQAVEEARQKRETRRAEKRVAEKTKQSARDQARKDTYLAREQTISKAQETRKIKTKND